MFDKLKECKSIISNLNLSLNQLDDECMKQLGEYLQDNEYVEMLSMRHNHVIDEGVEILSEYLIGNNTLEEWDLDNNDEIKDASIPHLIELV